MGNAVDPACDTACTSQHIITQNLEESDHKEVKLSQESLASSEALLDWSAALMISVVRG